jgi:transcriptional regulator with XRE-family HTH domain
MARSRKYGSSRAVPHLRTFLGQRLRAFRKERRLSQEALGSRAGLSGKFIGEVERGDKSISIDSLYRIAAVLRMPLHLLTDVKGGRGKTAPSPEAEEIFALVAMRPRAEVKRAYEVIRKIVG